MRMLLAATALLAACETTGHIRYGGVHQPAGSSAIYVDVQRWWKEYISIEPGRDRWKHLGVLRIDPTNWRARFESGRRFSLLEGEDAHGRVYRAEFQEKVKGYIEELTVHEPGKPKRTLLLSKGVICNLTPAPVAAGAEPYLFFVRQTHTANDGTQSGTPAVVRVRIRTGATKELAMPAKSHVWDWLAARDDRHVYLCGRSRRPRTWHGDFETGKWSKPIDGYFQPADKHGTLVERRDYLPGQTRGTKVRVIRNGKVEVIDVGPGGSVHAIFGTDWVAIYDGKAKTQVLRSLKTGEERSLPKSPPLIGDVALPPRRP